MQPEQSCRESPAVPYQKASDTNRAKPQQRQNPISNKQSFASDYLSPNKNPQEEKNEKAKNKEDNYPNQPICHSLLQHAEHEQIKIEDSNPILKLDYEDIERINQKNNISKQGYKQCGFIIKKQYNVMIDNLHQKITQSNLQKKSNHQKNQQYNKKMVKENQNQVNKIIQELIQLALKKQISNSNEIIHLKEKIKSCFEKIELLLAQSIYSKHQSTICSICKEEFDQQSNFLNLAQFSPIKGQIDSNQNILLIKQVLSALTEIFQPSSQKIKQKIIFNQQKQSQHQSESMKSVLPFDEISVCIENKPDYLQEALKKEVTTLKNVIQKLQRKEKKYRQKLAQMKFKNQELEKQNKDLTDRLTTFNPHFQKLSNNLSKEWSENKKQSVIQEKLLEKQKLISLQIKQNHIENAQLLDQHSKNSPQNILIPQDNINYFIMQKLQSFVLKEQEILKQLLKQQQSGNVENSTESLLFMRQMRSLIKGFLSQRENRSGIISNRFKTDGRSANSIEFSQIYHMWTKRLEQDYSYYKAMEMENSNESVLNNSNKKEVQLSLDQSSVLKYGHAQ